MTPRKRTRRTARIKRTVCALLCLCLCLAAVPAGAVGTVEEIRVLLSRLGLTDRADLWLSGPCLAVCEGTELLLRDGTRLTAQVRGGEIYLFTGGVSLRAGKSLTLRRVAAAGAEPAERGVRFAEGGNRYPGDLSLTVAGGQLRPVLTLPVEDYLLGVVPYEMNDSFPLEALKAQAVCARTYALSHRKPQADWDVVDTTNDQVFRGVPAGGSRAAQAVRETVGLVLMAGKTLATCYYAASNGGQTELPEHVWGSADPGGCYALADDPYDLANPESPVKRARLRADAAGLPEELAERLLAAAAERAEAAGFLPEEGLRLDGIESVRALDPAHPGSRRMTVLEVTVRWSGHRPWQAEADEDFDLFTTPAPGDGARPTATPGITGLVSGGATAVRIPLFPDGIRILGLGIDGNEVVSVREETDGGRVTGWAVEARRFGHGVGLSQRGAQQMAQAHGMAFDRILAFYYPGATLMRGGTKEAPLPTAPPRLAATPGPAATATPRPTLMPVTGPIPEGAWLASVEGVAEDSSLNLRAEPHSAAEILMRLYAHQRLVVLETCEDPLWVRVRTDAIEGYVMVSFLAPVED